MTEKPKMYQNKTNKVIHNNMAVYTSFDKKNELIKYDTGDIRKKINDIISSNSFIYSKLVHILIDNKIIMRKIIGVYNDNVMTIDNEYIPINNIQDIYI